MLQKLLLLWRLLRLLPLMGGRVVRLERLARFRVAIGLFGKTKVGHSQVLKILATAFVLLCLGEHIGRSKAVCISRPHHWRGSNISDFITNHDVPQSFRVLARKAEMGIVVLCGVLPVCSHWQARRLVLPSIIEILGTSSTGSNLIHN